MSEAADRKYDDVSTAANRVLHVQPVASRPRAIPTPMAAVGGLPHTQGVSMRTLMPFAGRCLEKYRGALRLIGLASLVVSLSVVPVAAFADQQETQSAPILEGSVAIEPSRHMVYTVGVQEGMMVAPRIVGHVEARGGSGNDVEVFVLTDSQYKNWRNGHSSTTVFSSGRVTACDLDVALPGAGSYRVVLSNEFSSMTTKTVEGPIRLTWLPAPPSKEAQEAAGVVVAGGLTILLCAGAIGGIVVWMIMSRKKKDSSPAGSGSQ